jgi:hypothetical protein
MRSQGVVMVAVTLLAAAADYSSLSLSLSLSQPVSAISTELVDDTAIDCIVVGSSNGLGK